MTERSICLAHGHWQIPVYRVAEFLGRWHSTLSSRLVSTPGYLCHSPEARYTVINIRPHENHISESLWPYLLSQDTSWGIVFFFGEVPGWEGVISKVP